MESENSRTHSFIDCNHLIRRLNSLSNTTQIKQWDLGASCSTDTSVQVDEGDAKQMKSAQRSSITVRVWNKEGLIGVTSTSDLSDNGLEKAMKGAYQASLFGNPNDIPAFSSLAHSPLPELDRPVMESEGIQRLFALLKSAEHQLLQKHIAIKKVPYNGIGETHYERVYINSEGALRQMSRSQTSIYLYARAEEKGNKPRSSGALRLSLGLQDLDIEGCINEAAERTINHLNYRPIETGKYLVCFTPEAFLELIGAFSSMFNARSIIDGVSLSNRESIGSKISVPQLSLYDNGLHPSNVSAAAFDGEGTPTSKICLINNGIVENFLHSEATARSFGVQPTGHAGLGAKVSVGPDWFEVVKNNVPHQEALSHKSYQEEFILIEGLNALHAGVKPSQGSFSLPFDGWIMRNGNKISIEAATIAGDIRNVLKEIISIEDEGVITHHGLSPYIWVSELSITGEA